MKVGSLCAAVFAGALLLSPAAHAQAPLTATTTTAEANAADIRCMVVALKMIANPDAQTKQHGYAAMMYFLGRVDGRTPGYDIENNIYTANKSLTGPALEAEGQRCGGMLITRGGELSAMGARISEREARDAR